MHKALEVSDFIFIFFLALLGRVALLLGLMVFLGFGEIGLKLGVAA